MPFMMMWMPYHYWNAIFAWQNNIADLMNYTRAKPREPKAIIADSQTSPIVAPASNLVVDVSEIAAEAKERRTEQPLAKLAKLLPPRRPSSSKKLKQSQKKRQREGGKPKGATCIERKSLTGISQRAMSRTTNTGRIW
ncbi:MAG: hypothetical protein ACXWCH_34790 [Burkholderiales bacterium]